MNANRSLRRSILQSLLHPAPNPADKQRRHRAAKPLGRALERLEDRRLLAYGLGENLIVNGSAESGLTGWTEIIGEMKTNSYFAPSGDAAGVFSPSGGGSRFFYGGRDGHSAVSQLIDLSSGASTIDLGLVKADLSAFLGGWQSQQDHAVVEVVWREADGDTIRSDSLRTVTAADRGHDSKLVLRSLANIPVPVGTRSALVIFAATRQEGDVNDGYVDNLSLVLKEGTSVVLQPGVLFDQDILNPPGTLILVAPDGGASFGGDIITEDGSFKQNGTQIHFEGDVKIKPGQAGQLMLEIEGGGGGVSIGGTHETNAGDITAGDVIIGVLEGLVELNRPGIGTGIGIVFSLTSNSQLKARNVRLAGPSTLAIDTTSSVTTDRLEILDESKLTGKGVIHGPVVVGGSSPGTVALVAPGRSPGMLTTGALTMNARSRLDAEIFGATAGSGYDQLRVRGGVVLNSPQLNTVLRSSFNPAPGQSFRIIDNDGTDAVVGNFAELPEGADLVLGGQRFHITYRGGDGNDVVLLRNRAPIGGTVTRSAKEDRLLSSSVPHSDSDGDGTIVQLVSAPSHDLTFSLNADGTFSYQADRHFSGTDTFKYRVTDGDLTSATYTATIDVAPVADAPMLSVQNASGVENQPIPLSITSALVDQDGSESVSLRISGVPAGVVLNQGTNLGGGAWSLAPGQLPGLAIESPDNQSFTLTVSATATESANRDTAMTSKFLSVTVGNVAPALTTPDDRTIAEGISLALPGIGRFTDPGFTNAAGGTDETFTYSIDWGDGAAADTGVATVDSVGTFSSLSQGSFDGSHIYADDGVYTVTVTVTDDDGGSDTETFDVTVTNIDPTLAVASDQTIAEGATLSLTDIGTFTDPGFDNPDHPNGASAETFTYSIDWGDGTTADLDSATVDVAGGRGVLTAGSFEGSHIYADDGQYTVTVTVTDDDGGSDTETFDVTVTNIDPTLAVSVGQVVAEGATLSLTDIGTFIDHGFDNPVNPSGASAETFAYSIDWGDGTTADLGSATVDRVGSRGVLTAGSFDGSHIYADDGVYTVTMTVTDDDGGSDTEAFDVTVTNIDPTLAVSVGQTIAEGATLSLTDIGTFTDHGFDNPANPNGASAETFSYSIDWGDGTTADLGNATVDLSGSRGMPTAGSFDGRHIYADDGVYRVAVTITDDDGGKDTETFTVTVYNVLPTVGFAGSNLNLDASGAPVPFSGVRGQTLFFDGVFSDPGFDNPANLSGASVETFGYVIDWGDGTTSDGGAATIDRAGARGLATAGSFGGSHIYAEADTYTATITVTDDDGGATTITRTITIADASLQVGGDLAVGGTTGADEIQFRPIGRTGAVEVLLDGAVLDVYQPTGRLLAFGQDGDDDVQLAGSVSLAAWLYGDGGDDRLKGGGGHDVLMGGLGDDLLLGHRGRDMMVGGLGADRIVGNVDDDILIAGYTTFDYRAPLAGQAAGLLVPLHAQATAALVAEWTSRRDSFTRIESLSGIDHGLTRANGGFVLRNQDDPATAENEQTVFDDGVRDFLTGSQGDDWFFFDPEDDKDKATDLRDEVFAGDLAWIGT